MWHVSRDMRKTTIAKSAELAGVFGHPLRLGILAQLVQQPRIVSDIVDEAGVDQAQVSKHLAILRANGLLQCSPEGRCRVYSLADADGVRAVLESLETLGRSAATTRTRCARASVSARVSA